MPVAPKTSVGSNPVAESMSLTPNELSEAVNWLNFACELGKDVMSAVESSRSKKTEGAPTPGGVHAMNEIVPTAKAVKRNVLNLIRRHLWLRSKIRRSKEPRRAASLRNHHSQNERVGFNTFTMASEGSSLRRLTGPTAGGYLGEIYAILIWWL